LGAWSCESGIEGEDLLEGIWAASSIGRAGVPFPFDELFVNFLAGKMAERLLAIALHLHCTHWRSWTYMMEYTLWDC
jgi:hypothetical protein